MPAFLAVLVAALILAPAALATSSVDLANGSAGPLTNIFIGSDLGCQVLHTPDTDYEFYPPSIEPGDCGTFFSTGGTLYAPDFANHGNTATASLGSYTPYTPISQSAVSGAGTSASPYRVTTTVGLGSTGPTITEADSYVVGDEDYRTDVTISNPGSAPVSGLLYRAADCFLGGSDTGYGFVDPSNNAPACTVNPNNTPSGRIEEFAPITGGIHYVETGFSTVWSDIGAQTDLPDTCDCATDEDNGAGINWDVTVPANGSITYSSLTVFSPTGALALTTSKTADSSTVNPGASDGYTITITNPNAAAVNLTDITDTLPAGFTYTPGSSTGATTTDPAISGQNLTWSGPFSVAGGGGTLTLHFDVTVSSTPGTYYNNAGADSTTTVTPTGNTAPITVSSPVNPATAVKFATQPNNARVGQTISGTAYSPAGPPVTVDIVDGTGNIVTSSTAPVTVALQSNPGGATLGGTTTVNAINGVATFNNLTVSKPGLGYTLRATSPGLTSATSSAFDVNTVAVACSENVNCAGTVSNSSIKALVTASGNPNAPDAGTLTVSLNLGPELNCPGFKAHGVGWIYFNISATTRSKTIAYTITNPKGTPASSFDLCYGAPYQFKTKSGAAAKRTVWSSNGTVEFVGLLPNCPTRGTITGPCIRSRTQQSSPARVTINAFVPSGLPGDPRAHG